MEPIKYFDVIDLIEPHCTGCNQIIHYDKDAKYDTKRQALMCKFCGSIL